MTKIKINISSVAMSILMISAIACSKKTTAPTTAAAYPFQTKFSVCVNAANVAQYPGMAGFPSGGSGIGVMDFKSSTEVVEQQAFFSTSDCTGDMVASNGGSTNQMVGNATNSASGLTISGTYALQNIGAPAGFYPLVTTTMGSSGPLTLYVPSDRSQI